MTIDVWMQPPTLRLLRHDMLAPLRRWTAGTMPDKDAEIPTEATVESMDAAGVDIGLLTAWRGPNGLDLVSNDDVAAWVGKYPNRFAGLATARGRRTL
jgi:predicted TIM-barrel fold metal-dependent hydrolase